MDYFTSDWHFQHVNIVKYCNRPFLREDGTVDIDLHDETLLSNINATVKPSDRLFVLGDIAMRATSRVYDLVSAIKCKQRFWVYGNHDNSDIRKMLGPLFMKSEYYLEVKEKEGLIVLSHYPMLQWNRSHHGSYMLHGHCHGTLKYPLPMRILDVGVDAHSFFPISRDAVEYYMRGIPRGEHIPGAEFRG